MEVKLDKRYPIAASVDQAWAVLSDIHATAACMPGAQITETIDATHYKGTVKSKIGPATMSFLGDIEVLGLNAEQRELRMLGKGADKSGSSASMELKAQLEPGATVTVSGKLAQFGSRLLVPVSDAMLAQFADNFRAAAALQPGAVAALAPAPAAGAPVLETAAVPTAAPAAVRAPVVAPPVKELNALGLMWTVVKGWFAGLFGRKT
jgi:uncharacterized protein